MKTILEHITHTQSKPKRHLISFTNGNAFSFVGSLCDLHHILKSNKWTKEASFRCIEL